jgi:hypothetical protein
MGGVGVCNVSDLLAVENGLAVFDKLLLFGLAVVVGWCVWHRPKLMAALVAGVVAWFEAGPNAPLWPVALVFVWLAWRAMCWLGRAFFVGGRLR